MVSWQLNSTSLDVKNENEKRNRFSVGTKCCSTNEFGSNGNQTNDQQINSINFACPQIWSYEFEWCQIMNWLKARLKTLDGRRQTDLNMDDERRRRRMANLQFGETNLQTTEEKPTFMWKRLHLVLILMKDKIAALIDFCTLLTKSTIPGG